jgi:hypothetical protein
LFSQMDSPPARRFLRELPMADHDIDRPAGRRPAEGEAQVDPMLQEGRAGSWRFWAVGIVVALVVAVVLYGIGTQQTETASSSPPPATNPPVPTGTAKAPTAPQPTGRGTASVPPTQDKTQGQGSSGAQGQAPGKAQAPATGGTQGQSTSGTQGQGTSGQ